MKRFFRLKMTSFQGHFNTLPSNYKQSRKQLPSYLHKNISFKITVKYVEQVLVAKLA
jgi:hypothetical protein